MKESVKFWNRIAKRYSKKPIENEQVYKKKLQITQDYLKPEMNVLEFGCGTGLTAIIHAGYVKNITAIDSSIEMINIAVKKAIEANINNVSFKMSSIEDLDMELESIDVILALSIIHLIDNKELVLNKVNKILKENGLFFSSTVCQGDLPKIIKIIISIVMKFGLIPCMYFFTVEELKQKIENAGFNIELLWQPEKSKAVFIVAKKIIDSDFFDFSKY
jgi:ubiquinone/menaquinone biosynthesis C-methylase UbiE